jgi:Protein of unknown function (DUF4227)
MRTGVDMMISWMKMVWNTTKVFFAFSICTLVFYFGLLWINQEYENYHRYDEPKGKAVKVFNLSSDKDSNAVKRLFYFYQTGE